MDNLIDFSKIHKPLITLAQLARENSPYKIIEVSQASQNARSLLENLMEEKAEAKFSLDEISKAFGVFISNNGNSLKIGFENKLALFFVQLDEIFKIKKYCPDNEYLEEAFDNLKRAVKNCIKMSLDKLEAFKTQINDFKTQINDFKKKWVLD